MQVNICIELSFITLFILRKYMYKKIIRKKVFKFKRVEIGKKNETWRKEKLCCYCWHSEDFQSLYELSPSPRSRLLTNLKHLRRQCLDGDVLHACVFVCLCTVLSITLCPSVLGNNYAIVALVKMQPVYCSLPN